MKKISETQTLNILEFAENGFIEGVDVDFEGKATNKFACNFCDFKNKDKGVMKRHIQSKHKPGGIKRQEHDNDTLEYEGEEKKAKTDDFEPDNLNVTVSGFSNEMIQKLLNEQFESNDENVSKNESVLLTFMYMISRTTLKQKNLLEIHMLPCSVSRFPS